MSIIKTKVLRSIGEVAALEWNALNHQDKPFLRHEFLSTLEKTHCVGADTGWTPQHITIWHEDILVGAAPAYLKNHSYGEFVFDWAWAEAYRRHGLPYYPKIVCCVPFTPVSGPRLLLLPGADATVATHIVRAVNKLAEQHNASSAHWLFTDENDSATLAQQGLALRKGFQFHWQNPGYASFDDYLGALTSKRRKNVKRERRLVAEAGITVKMHSDAEITPIMWQRFYELYAATTARKGGTPYLTQTFFATLTAMLPAQVLLATAYRDGQIIAAALCLRNETTLFGRNWGCDAHYDGLHFETCYYTPIEYCIQAGLRHFDAGAQGEHKLARGFLPKPTYSAHWIRDETFRTAIERFVSEEAEHVELLLPAAQTRA
jgi:hypothetical protein